MAAPPWGRHRESHRRAQQALDHHWPYTHELFDEREPDHTLLHLGIAPALVNVGPRSARVDDVLDDATLARPAAVPYRWFGRRGVHSEHLGYMLADMQYLQRSYPGAEW